MPFLYMEVFESHPDTEVCNQVILRQAEVGFVGAAHECLDYFLAFVVVS
jgi:hypothetical protein